MTTELTTKHDLPTPTPQHSQSLQPQELEEHRTKIAFDVEVVLRGYWQTNPPEAIKVAEMADWADTLENWTHEQVVWGLRKWRNENPSRKPNPGHILSLLLVQRAKSVSMEPLDAAERNIKSGKPFLCTNIGSSIVNELIAQGRVTRGECRGVGL